MKKHYHWAALLCFVTFISCKKDVTPDQAPKSNMISTGKAKVLTFPEKPALSKSMKTLLTSHKAKTLVNSYTNESAGSASVKLYHTFSNPASGIHKYLVYPDETAEPSVVISKKALRLPFRSGFNPTKLIQFLNEEGSPIPGHLVAKSKGQIIPLDSDLAARGGEPGQLCIDWYWVIFDEKTGTIIDEVFIETTCYNSEGGTGGGNGSISTTCNLNETEAVQSLSTATTQSMSSVSLAEGMELVDGGGAIRKAKTAKWTFLKMSGLAWTEQEWSAFFNGIIFKQSETDFWKWESFEYSSTKMTSGSVPPCFEIDLQIGSVSTSIDQDKKKAVASLQWTATLKAWCVGGWQIKTISGSDSQ